MNLIENHKWDPREADLWSHEKAFSQFNSAQNQYTRMALKLLEDVVLNELTWKLTDQSDAVANIKNFWSRQQPNQDVATGRKNIKNDLARELKIMEIKMMQGKVKIAK